MPRIRVPFVGGSARSKVLESSAERTINWIPEVDQQYAFITMLRQRPGLQTFAAAGASGVRGMITTNNGLFIVVGGEFKQVSLSGQVNSLGTLRTIDGPVGMAVNPTQVMVVDGTDGYIWDGTTFEVIADVDFPRTCTHVAYIDGYFVVNNTAVPGQFHISAINDGTTWDGTDFATAQRDPDRLEAVIVNYREVWLLGQVSTEVWYNSGNPDFPLDPIPSGFIEWGIGAPYSVAKLDGSIYWLAQNRDGERLVFKSQGLRGARISTHGIESRLEELPRTDDAIGYTMQWEGHLLYVLTFPTGDLTLVYDATTSLWHEWTSFGLGRFRGSAHAFFDGDHIIGDFQDGNLYRMKTDQLTDAGALIECERYDRHIVRNRDWIFFKELELQFEAGVGNAADSDPEAMLRWSDDGGHTWSNEHWRGIGRIGQYKNRAVWRRMGRSRDRVYRIRVTAPVKKNLVSGFIRAGS